MVLAQTVLAQTVFAPAKASIAGAYISTGVMPADQAAAGMGRATSYNTSIVQNITHNRSSNTQATATIAYHALGGDTANGQTLIYTGTGSSSGVTWSCQNSAATLPQKYMPANCRLGP